MILVCNLVGLNHSCAYSGSNNAFLNYVSVTDFLSTVSAGDPAYHFWVSRSMGLFILMILLLLPLALQPAVGFCLSNNISPFFPIYHQLSPSSHSQHLKISFYFFSPSFPWSSSSRPFQFLSLYWRLPTIKARQVYILWLVMLLSAVYSLISIADERGHNLGICASSYVQEKVLFIVCSLIRVIYGFIGPSSWFIWTHPRRFHGSKYWVCLFKQILLHRRRCKFMRYVALCEHLVTW
jgi:hypothetical protein